MEALYLMIPIALLLSFGFVGAFLWATLYDQWEDLDLAPRKSLNELITRSRNDEEPE